MNKEKLLTIIKTLKEQRTEIEDKIEEAYVYADNFYYLYGGRTLDADLYDCRQKIKEMASVIEELEDILKLKEVSNGALES
jgi:hypothetical protein